MSDCCRCASYRAYYTKGFSHFNRESMGYCERHERTVGNKEGCEFWRGGKVVRKKLRRTICLRALEEALSDLSQIKQILSEDGETDL